MAVDDTAYRNPSVALVQGGRLKISEALKNAYRSFPPCGGSSIAWIPRAGYPYVHDLNIQAGPNGKSNYFISRNFAVDFGYACLSQHRMAPVLAWGYHPPGLANNAFMFMQNMVHETGVEVFTLIGTIAMRDLVSRGLLVMDCERCDLSVIFYFEISHQGTQILSFLVTDLVSSQWDTHMEKVIWSSIETKDLNDVDRTCAMMDGDQVNVGLPSVYLGILLTNDVCLGVHASAGLFTFEQPVDVGIGGDGEPTTGGSQGGGQGGGQGSGQGGSKK